MDAFYFTSPRYETFCRNVSPFLRNKKKCVAMKHDVNDFIPVMKQQFVIPDIVFIDAVKKTDRLIALLEAIFRFNHEAIVVGDDYVFESVRAAVSRFKQRYPTIQLFTTKPCYLMTYRKIDMGLTAYLRDSIPEAPVDRFYRCLESADQECSDYIDKIDINKPQPRHNGNTPYTQLVIAVRYDKKKQLEPLMLQLKERAKPIKNVLGLTWVDYMKYPDLLY